MNIYRVFESYHEPSESGTIEYGCFSSFDTARRIVKEVWEKKGYPTSGYEEGPSGRWLYNGWDGYSISIREIELDKEVKEDCCGYT